MNLSTKIFLSVITVIFTMSVVFTGLFLVYQKQSLTEDLMDEGLALADLASYNARLGVFSENREFLDNTLTSVFRHKDVISCSVYSVDGKSLATRGDEHETVKKDSEFMELVRQSGKSQVREYQDRFEFMTPVFTERPVQAEEMLFYDQSVNESKEELIGFLHLTLTKKTLKEIYSGVVSRVALVSVLFVIFGATVSFFVSRRLTGPLNSLYHGVKSLSAGNIGEQVSVSTDDEIGSLAEAFNAMSSNLQERENERNRLIHQLEQSKRIEALGIFAGGISHDFNNILSIIQHNVDLAKLKAPSHVQDYLERVKEATRRGSSLVSRLLDFTTEKPHKEISINLGLLTRDVVRLFESNEAAYRIKLDIKQGLWMVKGDTAQLHRMLVNLITNAQEAIDEAARLDNGYRKDEASISIELENISISELSGNDGGTDRKEYIQIAVSDTGCGMDISTRQHIFEPFFTTKNKPKGTGLGLSTVYGIIKQHEGSITVESERGRGTTFQVLIPRSKEAILGVEHAVTPATEYVGGDETILLVDDEADILKAMQEALEDLGYTIKAAGSGQEALSILGAESGAIDLVIIDHLMPDITGVEVIHKMREQNMLQSVIVYSGSRLDQFREHLPGVHFVSKPFEIKELAAKIRAILGSERAVALKDYVHRVGLHMKQEPAPLNLGNISDSYAAYNLFKNIVNEPREVFMVLLLDSKNNLIAYEKLTTGTTNESQIYPKEVVRLALLTNATAVILIHNHPSGSLKPSKRDIVLTAAVSQACKIIDVTVHEHLIITEDGYTSLSREGYL